jgi:hypothetical protein
MGKINRSEMIIDKTKMVKIFMAKLTMAKLKMAKLTMSNKFG